MTLWVPLYRPDLPIEFTRTAVAAVMTALVNIDRAWIRMMNVQKRRGVPGVILVPPLHEAGVSYEYPREGTEDWRSIPAIAQGAGSRGAFRADCVDLTAWRIAELMESGEDPGARPGYKHAFGPHGREMLIHVYVIRGDGTPEDPSRDLGMR